MGQFRYCANRMGARASADVEHYPITGQIQNVRPAECRGDAEAVHAPGKPAYLLSLILMRSIDGRSTINLWGIGKNRPFQAGKGMDLIIIYHQIPKETKIVRALFEQIMLRDRGEGIAFVLQGQEAERSCRC